MNASLVVVGSGIKFISHLTAEARAYIEQSDKVLYLLNEPAMKSWIQSVNANCESLDVIYTSYRLREHSYKAITKYILTEVRRNQHVCVVLYGHPSVFAQPALEAVKQARQEGYHSIILPGISSEDCLFADLLIDPASHGCLSLEATDLLVHQRSIDVSCHVILWQASVIGMLDHQRDYDNQRGLELLQDYLTIYYPADHDLISYSAAQYPGIEPMIGKFKLNNLHEAELSRVTTLYVPPLRKRKSNKKILSELKINSY